MGIFGSLIKKEAIHIVRDKRTMIITLVMPLFLLILFGFAISTEVKNIKVVTVVDRHTEMSRNIEQRLAVNEYFTYLGQAAPKDIDLLLRTGKIDAALFIRTDGNKLATQIVVDASNTTSAKTATGYIQGILTGSSQSLLPILTQTLYNPQMKSAYNFVPGIMGMIFILICAIMTSVSIVREKESGTMDLLLVSPTKPGTIIMGKIIPYFILSCIILAIMLLIAYTVLELPFSASVFNVIILSLIYITLSLSIGLLVSTIVNTQLNALIISAVMFMIPVIMFSGMIFPIDNMPRILQYITTIIPARWYISAMRKLMIQQLPFSYIIRETIILGSMTIVLLTLAITKFKNSR
ncbi:MAG: ABC transporter permease [Muribaculaceae bacterium]|nr:ABC transporter permease [Muribaculaceae bacterium]